MGKRKHDDSDSEDRLERKIRRLLRKQSGMRHRRRRHSYSPSSSSESSRRRDRDRGYGDPEPVDEYRWPVDSNNEESPYDEDVVDLVDAPEHIIENNPGGLQSVIMQPAASTSGTLPPAAPGPGPAAATPTAGGQEPAAEPAPARAPTAAATAPAPTPTDTTPSVDASSSSAEQTVPDLEPGILSLLGDEPIVQEKFGPCIHKDIACRWSDILVNGLKDDVLNDIVKRYEIPENLRLAQAPSLNPEVKAACNESSLKRDNILIEKQKLLARSITGVAGTMSTLLTSDQQGEDFKNQALKSLSDAGRLLCHLHNSETQTRRHFLLTCLNKEVKDNIKDLKRDDLLFGKDLQDGLKSMKAISKTGAELKPTTSKSKPASKDKQADSYTPRALNWRGQGPAAVRPPPRRAPPPASYPRGPRRPPPPPRRTSSRGRAPPRSTHSRSSRR